MIAGVAVVTGPGTLRPETFPGRWSPRRAIPADMEPAPTAASLALESAGWWRPGSGQTVEGGLVVACDGSSTEPSLRFARELRDRPGSAVGPSNFLFSLPSAAAATLGLLFGLTDYQATLVGSRDSALQALRHALDMLALERVRRILVVALRVTPTQRVAVAWCLEPGALITLPPGSSKYEIGVDCGFPLHSAPTTIVPPSGGPIRILMDATEWLRSESRSSEPAFESNDEHGWISLERTVQE